MQLSLWLNWWIFTVSFGWLIGWWNSHPCFANVQETVKLICLIFAHKNVLRRRGWTVSQSLVILLRCPVLMPGRDCCQDPSLTQLVCLLFVANCNSCLQTSFRPVILISPAVFPSSPSSRPNQHFILILF